MVRDYRFDSGRLPARMGRHMARISTGPAALPMDPTDHRFVLEGICLSFFVVFPRRLITRRWLWLAIWVPVLITLPWNIELAFL